MRGLAILLAFSLLGLMLQELTGVPLPGNVIGLVLFSICLFAGWIKLHWVEPTANFLLRHLMLLFAPFVVGTMAHWDTMRDNWPAVLGSVVGGTMIVLISSGWTSQALRRENA